MKSIIIFVSCIYFISGKESCVGQELHSLSSEMINRINSLQTTWKAGRNFDGQSLSHVKRLLGTQDSLTSNALVTRRVVHNDTDNLPESFDAREAWPDCTSISTIYDQGSCGSDWAIAATSAISDRLCIHGSIQVLLSAQQVITCCYFCGLGCTSGDPTNVYQYYWTEGIVSGGLYQGTGCLPYTVEPCEHHVSGTRANCTTAIETPECKEECVASYEKKFEDDKFFGHEPYFFNLEPKQIMKEIMTNGPVTASLIVFADFPNYKSGVYHNTTTDVLGNHAVKLIGWGNEDDTDYWLAVNSWNDDWGDKGYFKIKRGTDESFVESSVVAALPKI